MSGLRKILIPERSRKRSSSPLGSLEGSPSPIENMSPISLNEQARPSYQQYQEHQQHPNCPNTLACLPDTDGRPQHTLPVILRCAILGSPRQRLTIREIYATMEEKYSYYKGAGPTWKQSVRHHLSLNRLFERQPRPVTDPGFGSYWTVNLEAPPGTKRPRKRGRSNKDSAAKETGAPEPKRRAVSQCNSLAKREPSSSEQYKLKLVSDFEPVYSDDPSYPSEGEDCSNRYSEEDYDSEESPIHPYEQRAAVASMATRAASSALKQHVSLPAFSTLDDGSNSLIEHLQFEIAGLRRQSAEAVSISLRLSDQLAEAQAEISRSRATLKGVEALLQEESRKRGTALDQLSDAHMMVAEEAKRRRAAEDALLVLQMKHENPSRSKCDACI